MFKKMQTMNNRKHSSKGENNGTGDSNNNF